VNFFQRLLVVISQTVNALVFAGNPDETISARCYREKRVRWEGFLNSAFFWEPDHCRKSHERDVAFAKAILRNEVSLTVPDGAKRRER